MFFLFIIVKILLPINQIILLQVFRINREIKLYYYKCLE